MTLKLYFPISVALFAFVVSMAWRFGAPILPFALILLTGETLMGFQLEDHRVGRFLGSIFKR